MRISVTFEVDVPDEASDNDIEDWLDFELGFEPCSTQKTINCDIEAISVDWSEC